MDNKNVPSRKIREVPIWERALLTINEASDYTGIGVSKLRLWHQRKTANSSYMWVLRRCLRGKSLMNISKMPYPFNLQKSNVRIASQSVNRTLEIIAHAT